MASDVARAIVLSKEERGWDEREQLWHSSSARKMIFNVYVFSLYLILWSYTQAQKMRSDWVWGQDIYLYLTRCCCDKNCSKTKFTAKSLSWSCLTKCRLLYVYRSCILHTDKMAMVAQRAEETKCCYEMKLGLYIGWAVIVFYRLEWAAYRPPSIDYIA